jgi:hypothetical protein
MSKRINEAGNRYTKLLVNNYSHTNKRGTAFWECTCDCGNKTIVEGISLRSGNTKSCGCLQKEKVIVTGHNNKGRKHTKETKRKISIHFANIERSEEWCRKISEALKGSKSPMWGKHHPKDVKIKMSIANSGNRHPNWKGGVACQPYCDAWADKEYKQSILERDNYQCQNPNCWHREGYAGQLTIHHIDYDKKNCSPDNLIVLCRSCNARSNYNGQEHAEMYQKIIKTGGLTHGNSSV